MRTGVQETRWFVRLLAVLGLFAIGGAFNEWFNPSTPPFKGRLAWLIEAIFAFAGTNGLVCLWLLAVAALTAAARFIWRRTPRLPSDRWL